MAEETPITKLLEPIKEFLSKNQNTLTNLVLSGITVGLNVLLNSELFDCPVEKHEIYGYLFLFAPFIVLLAANMLLIVVDWNPIKLFSKPPQNAEIFTVTLPSVTRVFVAPIVWLIVSLAETDYYVCANVGPGPDKLENLSTNETEALKARIAETKTESQIIAWGLFLAMVSLTFLIICLENVCAGKSKLSDYFSRAYYLPPPPSFLPGLTKCKIICVCVLGGGGRRRGSEGMRVLIHDCIEDVYTKL